MTLTAQSVHSADKQTVSSRPNRIASIDILRALTMVLMIFVNDLWSLTNIPGWLEHTTADQDGMGLADVVFPAFLFIVGMSIPFAVNNRRKKGDTDLQVVGHILIRAGALLVMGVFLVNGENINEAATGMPRLLWNTLCCISFILIWNAYPSTAKRWLVTGAKVLGFATLLTLAFMYRGGDGETLDRFSTYWWGILGLIGWAYLIGSLIYTFLGKNLTAMVVSWFVLMSLSMASQAGIVPSGYTGPLGNGSLAALTMGGIVISMIYLHFKDRNAEKKMLLIIGSIAALLFVAGFYTNRFWIIAKLGATPPWVLLCSGLTVVAFIFIYWLADMKGKAQWFDFIKPAGTNTLLCYLMPYFSYAVVRVVGIHWPEFMLDGGVGLLKSFLFALLCVVITGWLGKRGVQLKL